jgi:hypothetical protein
MSEPVKLIPMFCIHCQYPLAAQPDQTAWVCQQCGEGMLLSEEKGLIPLPVHYSTALQPTTEGKPFWVVEGKVSMERLTYQGNQSKEMSAFWSSARRFCIPAFNLPLDQLINLGTRLLVQPPLFQESTKPSTPVRFTPVTYFPMDVRPLAEFILLGIEAERKDWLRELRYTLTLGQPELWIFP